MYRKKTILMISVYDIHYWSDKNVWVFKEVNHYPKMHSVEDRFSNEFQLTVLTSSLA